MHIAVLVVLGEKFPKVDDAIERRKVAEKWVDAAMRPFGPCVENPRWDWYQIGGRWTGALIGFDAKNAAENVGKWPTEWAPHAGDVQVMRDINGFRPYAVVCADKWLDEPTVANLAEIISTHPDNFGVLVDVHF